MMKAVLKALVTLLACATAFGEDAKLSDVRADFGWRDCFRADADFEADFDVSVDHAGMADHWSEVVYLRAKRARRELGNAPFWAHEIDRGENPRAAKVHFVPNPRDDGLHIDLTLEWWESGAPKRTKSELIVPYLKDGTGTAGPFRYSVTWKKSQPNQPPLPTPGKCPPSNHDQVPGAADL